MDRIFGLLICLSLGLYAVTSTAQTLKGHEVSEDADILRKVTHDPYGTYRPSEILYSPLCRIGKSYSPDSTTVSLPFSNKNGSPQRDQAVDFVCLNF